MFFYSAIFVLWNILHYGRCAKPTVVTPTISIVQSGYQGTSDMYPGLASTLQLDVAFPGGTTNDVVIELLPSTNETIMILGDATVTHVGINTDISSPNIVRHQDPSTIDKGVVYDLRAVLDLGAVSNNGGASGTDDDSIKVEFDVILLDTPTCGVDATHWASAGVEYNNSYNVWIGQVSYICKSGMMPTQKVSDYNLAMVNPTTDQVPTGSIIKMEINALLPLSYASYSAEAISVDGADCIGVIGISVVDAGSNYIEFFDLTKQRTQAASTCGATGSVGPQRVRHDVGYIPNSGANVGTSSTTSDLIKFEVIAVMNAEEGVVCPLGVGVEVDEVEVWVSYVNLTSTAKVPEVLPFTVAWDQPAGSTVESGGNAFGNVNITIPSSSYTQYTITITSVGPSGPGLSILAIKLGHKGYNVDCPQISSTRNRTDPSSPVYDLATSTLYVTNTGFSALPDDNTLTLNIVGIVVSSVVSQNDVLKWQIEVKQEGGTIFKVYLYYTVSGTFTFDDPVTYSFTMYKKCETSDISAITPAAVYIDVTTERNKNPGPVKFEFPLATNISERFLTVCHFEVLNIGANLPCVNNENIQSTAVKNVTNGLIYKVEFTIDPLCNMELGSGGVEDDTFTIKILFQIMDPSSLSQGMPVYFGIGAQFSNSQVWVSQMQLDYKDGNNLPDISIVNGIAINSTSIQSIGDYVMQRSFDGIEFSSITPDWSSSTNNGTHDAYAFSTPFVAFYSRLAAPTCVERCEPSYEILYSSLENQFTIFEDKNKALKQKFPFLIDNDDSTCMTLPLQGQSPPVFWARMNTSLLSISPSSFYLNITGQMSCNKHTGNRVLQVSYPTLSSSNGPFEANFGFCKLTSENSVATKTCTYTCSCQASSDCSELFLFLSNELMDDATPWEICGLSAANTI